MDHPCAFCAPTDGHRLAVHLGLNRDLLCVRIGRHDGAGELVTGGIGQLNARQVVPNQRHRQLDPDHTRRCDEDLIGSDAKFCCGQPHRFTCVYQSLFPNSTVGAPAVCYHAVDHLPGVDQLAGESNGRRYDAVLAVRAGGGARALGEQEADVEFVLAGRLDTGVYAAG